MCSSFGTASNDLCNAITRLTRRICTEYIDPEGLTCLLANRLIALDKSPGLRPIEVGEVLRRIVAKAVSNIRSMNILKAAGDIQLGASQIRGCEAGVPAMTDIQVDV